MPAAQGSIRARISGSLKSRFGRWRLSSSSRVVHYASETGPVPETRAERSRTEPFFRKESPSSSFIASVSSDSSISSPTSSGLEKTQGSPPSPSTLSLEQPTAERTETTSAGSSGMFTLNLEGGAVYKGGISIAGLQHGFGRLVYANGAEYKGEWVNGLKHGMGVTLYGDGTKHVGAYKNGAIQGKGTMTWSNGTKYFGNFEDGLPHGYGSQICANAEFYHGEWIHGERVNGSVLAGDGKISHRLVSANEDSLVSRQPKIASRMISSVTEMETSQKRPSPQYESQTLKRTTSSRSSANQPGQSDRRMGLFKR